MKILDKIAFVVFALFALASVAGCSVNVEPSPEKDSGGTTPGDDVPDDGLTGADGNGGGGGDDSTGNTGIATVPVDANGSAQLAGECKSDSYQRTQFDVRMELSGENGAWDEVEIQIGKIHRVAADGQTLDNSDHSYSTEWTIQETILANPDSPLSSTPMTIFNNSPTSHLRIIAFGLYNSRNDADMLRDAIWEQVEGYPEVGPGKTIEIGLVDQPDIEVSVTPYCKVHVW